MMHDQFSRSSISELQMRIHSYFLENYGVVPAFPGDFCDLVWPSQKIIDVVLFGDGLSALMRSDTWPMDCRFRLWCLSQKFAKAFSAQFGLPENSVRALPRYELFPQAKVQRPFPDLNSDVTFVYSGRSAATKNFDLVCRVVARLQAVWQGKVRFEVCGYRFDRKVFERSVAQHSWKIRPRFVGSAGKEWVCRPFNNPVLINLSTYILEDFGVSLAEAQMAGWPAVISDWGGHSDVTGKNVACVSSQVIAGASQSNVKKDSSADRVAQLILDFASASEASRKTQKRISLGAGRTVKQPKVISYHQLSQPRRQITSSTARSFELIKEYSYYEKRLRIVSNLRKILGENLPI